MLSEQECLQICRKYELSCPICGTANEFFRLKRDICKPVKSEGDGHPLSYRWSKPGFDTVDPKQFFFGVCSKCRFAGELDDADFRQSPNMVDQFRGQFQGEGLRGLLLASSSGKGTAQSLGKRLRPDDPFGTVLAQFHLGVFCECLRTKLLPGNLARYYLRIAWTYRDQPAFYPEASLEQVAAKFANAQKRWARELPKQPDYPARPDIALSELEALRFSRTFFERNYETLREAKIEDELRLRALLAEIGFRIYELSSEEEDFRKGASFFSGAMQQCLKIISDKSIVGGVVNRAKEMLEGCGERGRELRELHQRRGGSDDGGEAAPQKPGKKKPKAAAGEPANGKKAVPTAPEKKVAGKAAVAPSAASADGDQRGLDQATRQVALLEEEASSLRERVKVLEEDNKKWRQLAGRDAVTGLPNKTMLLRLVLPKALRAVDQSGPLSCIAISFDQVAQVNQGHGWLMGDRMLKESARSLRQFVREGEELYRLEGVHFAIFGPMSSNDARQRAADIRRRLSKANVQLEDSQFPLVASLGVVTVDRVAGGSPAEASGRLFEALLAALYRAKEKGGNTVEAHSATRF